MSVAGGMPKAVERIAQVKGTALQVFVKNNNQWQGRRIGLEEANEFRNRVRESPLEMVAAHSSYLINLASPDAGLWQKSIQAMVDEGERCSLLGIPILVVHPGAHRDSGESQGIVRVARALDHILESLPDPALKVALETTAGQGTSLGWKFEHLRDVLSTCRYPSRVVVCVDTCHIFAAGYDIRKRREYAQVLESFDQTVGLERIALFHLNDSKHELGRRVDRHDHIGQGKIGTCGFRNLMQDGRLARVPKVIETPKGKGPWHDRRNLGLLRRLARS